MITEKVLTKSGLQHLWDRIKEKLNLKADKADLYNKQDKMLIVTATITGSSSNQITATLDKTHSEILAAMQSNKNVYMHIPSLYDGVYIAMTQITGSRNHGYVCYLGTDLWYCYTSLSDSSNTCTMEKFDFATTSDIPDALSDLTDDATHRLVTDTEKSTWNGKQNALTFDSTPTDSSSNPVTSGGVKTALDVKQDENFVVAFTTSSNVYSADKTFAATYAAYNAGKNVICTAPTELGTSVGSVSLIAADIVVFTIPWDDGTDAYIDVYYLYEDDSVDFVSKRVQKKLTFDQTPKAGSSNPVASKGIKTALNGKQDTLVSGTNIKTINNTSLLDSGNLDLTKKVEYSTTASMEADSSQPNGTIGYDAEEENWYIYDMPNGEWRRIDIEEPNEIASITTNESSVSGGNNTVMITETNGTTHTFNVKNGIDGQDGADGANGVSLGEVAIADDQTTDDATKVLSARQGKLLGDDVSRLKDYEFGVKTYDENDLFKNKSYTNGGTTAGKRMTALSNFGCIKIPVTKGDKLTIATSGASGARAYSLCDEDLAIYLVSSSGKDTTSNPETISVTKDGYCHINCKSSAYANFGVTHYYSLERQMLTDNTRSLTQGEMDGTSDWIRDKLEALGWEFDQYVKGNTGTTAASDNYCATPFIPVSEIKGHSITFCYMFNAWSTGALCFYNSSKTFISGAYYGSNVDNLRTVTIPTSSSWDNVAYLRFTCNSDRLSKCYIYDNTDEVYIWKGDEYLGTIYEDNLVSYKTFRDVLVSQESGKSTLLTMSQKAIYDGLQIAGYLNKPTYLQGRLCYFSLANYPNLDPRTADGISVVFTTNSKDSERTPMFDIWNPNNGQNSGMANRHFGLWNWDGNISFGFFSNYGAITTGGYNFSRVKGHYVITYDFKTGICKCYKNGVLVTTGSPTTWDEQTMVRDYFNTCTHIHLCSLDGTAGHKSTGIAVYGSVLTDEDVASIYGNGNESIKKILTPAIYQANHLHPILMNNWTIHMNSGTATPVTGGGYIVNVASSGSYVSFGFKGIEGLINNLIYEWDFEITSGSSTHDSTISYSRAMRTSGPYYKCFVIYDSNGNDVTFDTLGVGTYHVVSKPNNVQAGGVNTDMNVYPYIFLFYCFLCSSDFSMTILPTLKLTERGAALECSIRTYRGVHWELPNGIKLPLNDSYIYETFDFILGTDTFIEDTVIYAANQPPQFNGQMAVDTTNGKVYVGYLTGTGGTWKQINNS